MRKVDPLSEEEIMQLDRSLFAYENGILERAVAEERELIQLRAFADRLAIALGPFLSARFDWKVAGQVAPFLTRGQWEWAVAALETYNRFKEDSP